MILTATCFLRCRVRRSEFLHHSSPPSSPSDTEAPNALRFEFDFVDRTSHEGPPSSQGHNDNAGGQRPDEGEKEAFEFRLFSTSTATARPTLSTSQINPGRAAEDPPPPAPPPPASTQQAGTGNGIHRITIRSPTPPSLGTGGFLVPHRPQDYYFTGPPPASESQTYTTAAVSGQEVLTRARQTRWVRFMDLLPVQLRLLAFSDCTFSIFSQLEQFQYSIAG